METLEIDPGEWSQLFKRVWNKLAHTGAHVHRKRRSSDDLEQINVQTRAILTLLIMIRMTTTQSCRGIHPCSVPLRIRTSVFLSRSSAASYILLIRDSSISLWAGLPPRPEVFVEARDVRTFECDEHSANGATAAQIVLEWNDGQNLRRLLVDPIAWGLRGISPPPALTAAAVHRGRLLIGLEVATDAV